MELARHTAHTEGTTKLARADFPSGSLNGNY
jgi:hypothetical protein